MEYIEQIWAWVQANPAIVLNGAGGVVLGPILAKILRGGAVTGALGGLIGGVGAGFGADMAGLNDIVSSALVNATGEGNSIWGYLQDLAEGAAGGGGIGGVLGVLLKRR